MNQMNFQSKLGNIAYWKTMAKQQPAKTLVFLHGWPFNSRTFRKLHPLLCDDYNCVLLDWPGLGESLLDPAHAQRVNFATMAEVLDDFLAYLQVDQLSLIAHDTGATIARLAVANGLANVDRLICFSTELPGHQLALIPRLKRLFALPFMPQLYMLLLSSKAFIKSKSGFANCVARIGHLDAEFIASFVAPIINDPRKRDGLIAYLNGIDWEVVDDLHQIQSKISQPVAMVWGLKDQIFPIELARDTVTSFGGETAFFEIPDAGFLAVEEQPIKSAQAIRRFLQS